MCQKGVWVKFQMRCRLCQNVIYEIYVRLDASYVRMPGEVHAESECQVRCKLCQTVR